MTNSRAKGAETPFTPGPWSPWIQSHSKNFAIYDRDYNLIAEVMPIPMYGMSNGLLMAYSPEMLEILEDAVSGARSGSTEWLEKAELIISKARGLA